MLIISSEVIFFDIFQILFLPMYRSVKGCSIPSHSALALQLSPAPLCLLPPSLPLPTPTQTTDGADSRSVYACVSKIL